MAKLCVKRSARSVSKAMKPSSSRNLDFYHAVEDTLSLFRMSCIAKLTNQILTAIMKRAVKSIGSLSKYRAIATTITAVTVEYVAKIAASRYFAIVEYIENFYKNDCAHSKSHLIRRV